MTAIVVDSSALVAVVLREAGHDAVVERLVDAADAYVGTPTLVEAGIVLRARLGGSARILLESVLDELGVETLSFEERHWRAALDAFTRFGKGRHPAALSFGDCLSYAVARVERRPLLCVGNEFALTDLTLA